MGNSIEKFNNKNKNKTDKLEIYLVSLPKDQERRNHLNVIPDYTYAVDGSALNIEKIIYQKNPLTKGEIGCYMSHVHMLKKALKSSSKYVMIIEDDVGPIDLNKMSSYIEQAPPDFDLLFLSYNYYEHFEYDKIKLVYGLQCYIVNTSNITAEKINSLFPITAPIDVILPSKFVSYIIKPKVVALGQFSNYSNTQGIR